MSLWSEHELTSKILSILSDASTEHHFGRPYLTAYQLAIGLQRRYPDTTAAIGKPVAGQEPASETA